MTVSMHPGRLKQRTRVEYKKPSKINSVSVGMTLFMGLLAYLIYCCWPAFILTGNVNTILQTRLMDLYKLNLSNYGDAQRRYFTLEKDLEKAVHAAGVADKDLKIVLHRDKKFVSIEAKFTTIVELEGLNKRFTWNHSPKVETSAARVDW